MLPIRFLPHSVNLNTHSGVAAWLNQIDATTPEAGVSLFEESSGSGVDREFVAAKGIAPTLAISSSDLSFLTTCGMNGVFIDSGSGTPGVTVYGRELPFGAVPTAIGTADHLKLIVNDGLLVPVSMRVAHNAVARLNLMLHATLGPTGSTDPFQWSASSTITSGAGNIANIYTGGPFKYTITGGSSRLVQGIQETAVSFGIDVDKQGSDSEASPTHVAIISRMSKIEFTTNDVELISEIGDGISVSAAAAYFTKAAANGIRVAKATTSHVSVVGTAGMITPGAVNLTHKKPGTASFTYTPVLNTQLLTLSAAAAIPAS